MNQQLKDRLASPKGKKLLAVCVCLIVAGAGLLLLSGRSSQADMPHVTAPMSAKQAMAAARAKLAAEHRAPAGPVPSKQPDAPKTAVAAAPASVGAPASVADPVATSASSAAQAGIAEVHSAHPVPAPTPKAIAPASPIATPVAAIAAAPQEVVAKVPAASPAETQTDVSAADEDLASYNRQMDAMQRQIRFMQAQAKIAELKRKIDDAQGQGVSPASVVLPPPSESGSGSDGVTTPIASIEVPNHPAARTEAGPSLSSVMMVDGKYQAVLNTRGADLVVQEGASLGDGWRVRSINATSVVIAKGRKRKTLTIGG